jgi:hypothetical protein
MMQSFNLKKMNDFLGIEDIKSHIDEQWLNIILLKKQQDILEEIWAEKEELSKKTFKKELIVEKKQKTWNWSINFDNNFFIPIRND